MEFDYKTDFAIDAIVKKELKILSEKDKQIIKNTPAEDLHFGYGLYLRNRYIYGNGKVLITDDISEEIIERIKEKL